MWRVRTSRKYGTHHTHLRSRFLVLCALLCFSRGVRVRVRVVMLSVHLSHVLFATSYPVVVAWANRKICVVADDFRIFIRGLAR